MKSTEIYEKVYKLAHEERVVIGYSKSTDSATEYVHAAIHGESMPL